MSGASEPLAQLPAIEFNPDSIMLLKGYRNSRPFTAEEAEKFSADIRRICSGPATLRKFVPTELRAWRLFGAELMPLLEDALAAQGDAPDARILSLQHSLAELLRLPANNP